MSSETIAKQCEDLAQQCEILARRAERLSFPMGQALYNAGANLEDAAIMARELPPGRKPRKP